MDSSWDYKEVKFGHYQDLFMQLCFYFQAGDGFTMFTETTTNSEIFAHYLVKMNDWIYNNNMFGYNFFFYK